MGVHGLTIQLAETAWYPEMPASADATGGHALNDEISEGFELGGLAEKEHLHSERALGWVGEPSTDDEGTDPVLAITVAIAGGGGKVASEELNLVALDR